MKPGAFLLRSQSLPISGMSSRKTDARSVRSLAIVYPATAASASSSASETFEAIALDAIPFS